MSNVMMLFINECLQRRDWNGPVVLFQRNYSATAQWFVI